MPTNWTRRIGGAFSPRCSLKAHYLWPAKSKKRLPWGPIHTSPLSPTNRPDRLLAARMKEARFQSIDSRNRSHCGSSPKIRSLSYRQMRKKVSHGVSRKLRRLAVVASIMLVIGAAILARGNQSQLSASSPSSKVWTKLTSLVKILITIRAPLGPIPASSSLNHVPTITICRSSNSIRKSKRR